MRRIFTFVGLVVLVMMGLSFFPMGTTLGQFATNTPSASNTNNSNTAISPATATSASGFVFATNTPAGPTSTPSSTPSPTSTATATATDTATLTPTPTPTFIGPFQYPENINALTGLPFPNEEAKNRRNLIIKISNYPPIVRPQTGLNRADVVYEYEVEGGVTRFAAIFRSQTPPLVGSVRSARLFDMQLTTMYSAFLAYSGTSEPIQQLLLGAPFFNYQLISPSIGDNCEEGGFCRYPSGDLPFEHTLFVEPAKVWELAARRNSVLGIKAKGFAFSEIADANGEPANDIEVNWYGQIDARWQYDPQTARYVRFTDGQPHIDKADGQQLWIDNLVIIEVPHVERPDLFPEGATYVSQDIQLVDQGRAYVVRDGQFYVGFWRRQNQEEGSALQLIYGNNTPIMLKPGRTWVEVVRGFGDVVISGDYADMSATATAIALTPTATPLNIQEGDESGG
jgi:hypothetical protein